LGEQCCILVNEFEFHCTVSLDSDCFSTDFWALINKMSSWFWFQLFYFLTARELEEETFSELRRDTGNSLFFIFFGTGALYVTHAGLKLVIPLPPPLECWDYRCAPPCLAPSTRDSFRLILAYLKFLEESQFHMNIYLD
jgi:hypothetical protein